MIWSIGIPGYQDRYLTYIPKIWSIFHDIETISQSSDPYIYGYSALIGRYRIPVGRYRLGLSGLNPFVSSPYSRISSPYSCISSPNIRISSQYNSIPYRIYSIIHRYMISRPYSRISRLNILIKCCFLCFPGYPGGVSRPGSGVGGAGGWGGGAVQAGCPPLPRPATPPRRLAKNPGKRLRQE